MKDLISILEYLKGSDPILNYSESLNCWQLEFDKTYGEQFEAPNLQDLAEQLEIWLTTGN